MAVGLVSRHHVGMIGERFVRVQAAYRGRLGVEVGVFVAVDHLRRAGRLTPDEEALYLDIDDWFTEHLPNPDFYADGNSIGAVTWFKSPVPPQMHSEPRRSPDPPGVGWSPGRLVDDH